MKNKYHKMYLAWEINEYELADLLKIDYTEIGAYILTNRLVRIRQSVDETLTARKGEEL